MATIEIAVIIEKNFESREQKIPHHVSKVKVIPLKKKEEVTKEKLIPKRNFKHGGLNYPGLSSSGKHFWNEYKNHFKNKIY
jgi:hypothetical protein